MFRVERERQELLEECEDLIVSLEQADQERVYWRLLTNDYFTSNKRAPLNVACLYYINLHLYDWI